MTITRARKEEQLKELENLLEGAKSIVVTDYRGINVESIKALRRELSKEGITLKVAKKTLLSRALVGKEYAMLSPDIMDSDAQIALAVSTEDEVAPFRILSKVFKKLKTGKLLGGYIGTENFESDKAIVLANLPSKQELIAKMVGGFKAPLSRFHGVLSNTLGGFVRVLNAIKDKQEA